MSISIDTQDLVNYPGNVKRVTIDQESVVPQGFEGDSQFMLSFSTTAYSDITAKTKIQDLYVTDFKSGWCKSSGFAGNKFALDATHRCLEIKMDATTSGIGDGYYRVTLDHNDGVQIDAEVVAEDLENKIRALADNLDTADIGYKMAYMNAVVEFKGGRFWIVSGSVGKYYSGANRTSVKVRASSVNDCSDILGFNVSIDSEIIDSIGVKEALVLSGYTTTSGTGTITISANVGAVINDCMLITDGTNTDYFQISDITGGTIIEFDGSKVSNSYSASKAKVQLLREQDPDAGPSLWFDDIDKITRYGLKSMINQIDYSS
jgi:hypothetical protein